MKRARKKTQFIESAKKRASDFALQTRERNIAQQQSESAALSDTAEWKRQFTKDTKAKTATVLAHLARLPRVTSDASFSQESKSKVDELIREITDSDGANRDALIVKQTDLIVELEKTFMDKRQQFFDYNKSHLPASESRVMRLIRGVNSFLWWPVQIQYTLEQFNKSFVADESVMSNIEQEVCELQSVNKLLKQLYESDNDCSNDLEITKYTLASKLINEYKNDGEMFLVGLLTLQQSNPYVAQVLNYFFSLPYELTIDKINQQPEIIETLKTKAVELVEEAKEKFYQQCKTALSNQSMTEEQTVALQKFAQKYESRSVESSRSLRL